MFLGFSAHLLHILWPTINRYTPFVAENNNKAILLQTDLMGQSIFNLISLEDVDRFRMYLNPNSDMSEADWRKYFNVHIKRAGPRNESPVYELVNIMGMQRPTENSNSLINGRDLSSSANNNDVSIRHLQATWSVNLIFSPNKIFAVKYYMFQQSL